MRTVRTWSDTPFRSVLRTSGPDGPGGSGDEDQPPRTWSDEPVNGVVHTSRPQGPVGPGVEDSPLRTGFGELINSVACTSGPDGVCSGRALHRIASTTSARNTMWMTVNVASLWKWFPGVR